MRFGSMFGTLNAIALATSGAGIVAASPAAAIDCAKAASSVEKRICANPSLKAADTAMGQAYAALLKRAPDAEIRAMLVKSQRRWIAARDKQLASGGDGKALSIGAARDAIAQRTRQLSDSSENGFIAVALDQRRYFGQFPAGQFSGFETSCDFLPTDRNQRGAEVSYACFGSVHVQNGARLCDLSHDWATYALYDYYGVSQMTDGAPLPEAYCNGQSGHGCDAGSPDWLFTSSAGRLDDDDHFPIPGQGMDKLDAEGVSPIKSDFADWFNACVNRSNFPR